MHLEQNQLDDKVHAQCYDKWRFWRHVSQRTGNILVPTPGALQADPKFAERMVETSAGRMFGGLMLMDHTTAVEVSHG